MNLMGMPRPMLIRIQFPRLFPVLFLLCFVHLPASNAQNAEPFKFFRDYVGLKEDQIAAIRNGKAVAKVVESRKPDEVFVFGSVYVQSTPEKYLKLASDIDALRKLPSYLAIRKFNDPPQLSDLDGFTLEADDIKQLKNCEPGKCDVRAALHSREGNSWWALAHILFCRDARLWFSERDSAGRSCRNTGIHSGGGLADRSGNHCHGGRSQSLTLDMDACAARCLAHSDGLRDCAAGHGA
jgi:hypothetical protein